METKLSGNKAAEGISRLLLGPVYLIVEIYGALLPGILFFVLLVGKGNQAVTKVFQTAAVGYKTKLLIVLLLCYVIGKAFRLPAEVWERRLMLSAFPKSERDSQKDKWGELRESFLGGAIAFSLLFRKGIDYLAVEYANTTFHLTTGGVLLVASAIPGDGNLRYIEFAVGLGLFLVGLQKLRRLPLLVVSFLGMSWTDELAKLPSGSFPDALKTIVSAVDAGKKTTPKD